MHIHIFTHTQVNTTSASVRRLVARNTFAVEVYQVYIYVYICVNVCVYVAMNTGFQQDGGLRTCSSTADTRPSTFSNIVNWLVTWQVPLIVVLKTQKNSLDGRAPLLFDSDYIGVKMLTSLTRLRGASVTVAEGQEEYSLLGYLLPRRAPHDHGQERRGRPVGLGRSARSPQPDPPGPRATWVEPEAPRRGARRGNSFYRRPDNESEES
jgi:hypothetical protein